MEETEICKENCRESCRTCSDRPLRLWILEFLVKGVGKGCAVVKAGNPREAEMLLKTDGNFNGAPYLYSITRIEEIPSSPDSMLLCEIVAPGNKTMS